MKEIVYTCDICKNKIKEPEDIFALPLYVGFHNSENLITTPIIPKIEAKSLMLCNKCQQSIAKYFLDRGIVTEDSIWHAKGRVAD